MQHSQSEISLHKNSSISHLKDKQKRISLDTGSHTNFNFDQESLEHIVKIQHNIINSYRNNMTINTKQLQRCQDAIHSLEYTNEFDVEKATNALLHNCYDDNQKIAFKNALLFMQNRVKLILASLDDDEDKDEKT